jgi:pimeloyl-ACP methyl ester carboxylesterase
MSAHYALRYPYNIKKLILMSPAGISDRKAVLDVEKKLKRKLMKSKEDPSKLGPILSKMWDKKVSPFAMMRKSGNKIANKIVKRAVTNRMGCLPPEELADMIDYMHK